ncbi:MFS transporter [Pseudoxanthomonas beigongshangi]
MSGGDGRCDAVVSSVEVDPPLPWAGLLALACAGFITILTEALPAGLLPAISADLGVSEAWVGQLVTVYAVGSLLAAIPLVAATRHCRRRPLLLMAIGGFTVANSVTAVSPFYDVTLVARFIAGVSAGLLWALLAVHASRMVAPAQQGRAIAVAMVGTPLALSLGIPAGTLLGQAIGWRWTFGLMSLLSLGLLAWARVRVPDFAGQARGAPLRLRRVLALPGVLQVLGVMLLFVFAHNVLYTYIAPVLSVAGADAQVERYLLLFGATALVSIGMVGVLIDRWLHGLTLASLVLFGMAAMMMALWPDAPMALAAAVACWGLGYGGVATLFQTALARNAGETADIATSMLVTGWNLAIAGGGILGGLLLQGIGPASLSWTVLLLLLPALGLALPARGWR